jgi:hypothetical protein
MSGIDLFRPFRAYDIDERRTRGVAPGWIISPRWGCDYSVLEALKGQNNKAQGNALGNRTTKRPSPEGAE